MGAYFTHRLRIAGYTGPQLLSAGARHALYRGSRGVPRLVNILAHKALLLVYGEGGWSVERRQLRAARLDTPAAVQPRGWWPLSRSLVSRAAK